MTRKEAQKIVNRFEEIKAFALGKKIQFRDPDFYDGQWHDVVGNPNFIEEKPNTSYRVKPEKTLRPWRPEEVPVGALLQYKNKGSLNKDIESIIGRSSESGNAVIYTGFGKQLKGQSALEMYEHSLDNGKTWLPCGVYENE